MAKRHNPFSIFRRNQRAWMAGLTLFTMFSFIALGSMLQCVGTRNQGTGPHFAGQVARTSKFGSLSHDDFQNARYEALRLQQFVSALAESAQSFQAQPSEAALALRVELNLATVDSQTLVDRWLVSQYAQRSKMRASDQAAVQYLQLLTQVTQYGKDGVTTGSLPAETVQQCMRVAGLSESSLRELLKSQITLERYIRQFDGGRRMTSLYSQVGAAQMGFGHGAIPTAPAETLEAYEALTRQAKAKVAVFKASDFVDQIADPTEDQIEAFYTQYKDVVYRADSKEPGFTQPTKIALEIVRADLGDELLNSISSEEVQAYYDAHKEEFRRPKPAAKPEKEESPLSIDALPTEAVDAFNADEDATAEEAPATEAPAAEAPATETPAAEVPATETPAAPAEGAFNYKKSDILLVSYQQEAEQAPAAEAPATEAPVAETPATEEPAAEVPATEAPVAEAPATEEPAAEAPATEASVAEAPATEEPAAEAPATEAPVVEAPATEEPAAEAPATEAPVAEAPATEAPVAEVPATEAPVAEAPATEAPVAEAPATEEPAAEAPATETPAAEAVATEVPAETAPVVEEDSEYMPLAIVESMIRRRIACEKLEAKMAALSGDLQKYYHATIMQEGQEGAVEAQDVDMAAFAKENGFQYHVTSRQGEDGGATPIMISQEAASFAKVLPDETLESLYQSAPIAYSSQRVGSYDPVAHPEQAWNMPSTFYVFRVVQSEAQNTPELEEARDFVVETYKLREASKIAKQKADELAEKAKAEGADFNALATEAGAVVVETEKFSWFQTSFGPYGEYAQPAEVREVGVESAEADRANQELVAPGWNFYKTVFGLEQGGIGVCLNQPEDRAFVVNVTEKDPEDSIRNNFAEIDDNRAVNYVMMWLQRSKLEKYHEDLIENLRKEAGFEWVWIPRVEAER